MRLRLTFPRYAYPDGDPTPAVAPPAESKPPSRTTSYSAEDVEAIVEARLMRERAKMEARMGGPKALEELEALRKEREDRERKRAEEQGNYQAALASKDEAFAAERTKYAETLNQIKAELRKDRVRSAIVAAAADARAINADQVADLLENRRVTLDDETLQTVCLGPDGRPMFKNGKPMAVKDLVAEYLEDNPHLVHAAGTGGAGSRGGATASDTAPTLASSDLRQAEAAWQAAYAKAEKTGDQMDVANAFRAKTVLDRLARDLKGAGA